MPSEMLHDAHALARTAAALLATIMKLRGLAAQRQFGPDFEVLWQRFGELRDAVLDELSRARWAGDERAHNARGWADVLCRALTALGMALRDGNLDLAEGSPLGTYHALRARAGSDESARWLRDNIHAADNDGRPVDPYLRFLVGQMRKGGLRKSTRLKRGCKRGKRGHAAFGRHNQLLLAREVWKQHHLGKHQIDRAAMEALRALRHPPAMDSAINAYYRFQRGIERRALYVELTCDYLADPLAWRALAHGDNGLMSALQQLEKLKPPVRIADPDANR